MTLLFNNCGNRNHPSIYADPAAFFDVQPTGSQTNKCAHLQPGDLCIVASYASGTSGPVKFTRWKYTHQSVRPDNQGELLRVFCGEQVDSKTMPKADAAASPEYAGLFNKRGHFKQISVFLRPD